MTYELFLKLALCIVEECKEHGVCIDYKVLLPQDRVSVIDYLYKNNINLPNGLIDFFSIYSSGIIVSGKLPSDITEELKPLSLRYINFNLSLQGIIHAEKTRIEWINNVYSDINLKYDREWYDKTGIISIDNGDVISLDDKGKVVYLSHDGGIGHGLVLGETMEDFLENSISIRLVDYEDICARPVLVDDTRIVDFNSKKYDTLRQFIRI